MTTWTREVHARIMGSTYKQSMKGIIDFPDDVDATDEDHENGFCCNLESHFKSDCTHFWDAVADAKEPRHEEALSARKASRARLMNGTETRNKEAS